MLAVKSRQNVLHLIVKGSNKTKDWTEKASFSCSIQDKSPTFTNSPAIQTCFDWTAAQNLLKWFSRSNSAVRSASVEYEDAGPGRQDLHLKFTAAWAKAFPQKRKTKASTTKAPHPDAKYSAGRSLFKQLQRIKKQTAAHLVGYGIIHIFLLKPVVRIYLSAEAEIKNWRHSQD